MNQENSSYCHVSGKVKHVSANAAHKAVSKGKKSGSVYKCPHCHEYHHTTFIDGMVKEKAASRRMQKKGQRKPW